MPSELILFDKSKDGETETEIVSLAALRKMLDDEIDMKDTRNARYSQLNKSVRDDLLAVKSFCDGIPKMPRKEEDQSSSALGSSECKSIADTTESGSDSKSQITRSSMTVPRRTSGPAMSPKTMISLQTLSRIGNTLSELHSLVQSRSEVVEALFSHFKLTLPDEITEYRSAIPHDFDKKVSGYVAELVGLLSIQYRDDNSTSRVSECLTDMWNLADDLSDLWSASRRGLIDVSKRVEKLGQFEEVNRKGGDDGDTRRIEPSQPSKGM